MKKSLEETILCQLSFSSKFESYNLQHCKKNCHKLVFCVFPEQLLSFIFLGGYIALQKRFINHYYKRVKQRFSNKKDFIKHLFKVNEKKNSGILRLNKIMSKLLTISKCLQLNCQYIQHLLSNCYIVLNMPSVFIFHISHII